MKSNLSVSVAVLFPGQGSQAVGMGADLFSACPDLLGERSDRILGYSLASLCLEGPEERLIQTQFAQPALFALGYAMWTVLAPSLPGPPAAAAGHSLGEYTALAAAGTIGFEEGLALVAARGAAMSDAAAAAHGGMAALLGGDEGSAARLAAERVAEGGRLYVANLNAPGQTVMAGAAEDLDWLEVNAGEHGVKRVVRLKVAGAFHTPFMAEAVPALEAAVAATELSPAAFPVWSNVTARPAAVDELASLLVRQVVSPVRFSETLSGMHESGVDCFIHVGPGDVTAGMARRTVPEAQVLVANRVDGIQAAMAAIGTIG